MILGSHNSWSYLPPKHWWMKLLLFMAKCQSVDIQTQYEKYGVRCFDLRLLMKGPIYPVVAHGLMQYKLDYSEFWRQMNYLNDKKDCYIRILNESRTKDSYEKSKQYFIEFCSILEEIYPDIKFWCGKNLYNWKTDYIFQYSPSYEEKYASVCPPRLLDDWIPWLYAKRYNHKNITKETNKDILLIDFVNIQL